MLEADIDVEDVEAEDGSVTVYTAPTDLHRGIEALRAGGVAEFQVTELEMIPQSEVTLEGKIWKPLKNLLMLLKTMTMCKKFITMLMAYSKKKPCKFCEVFLAFKFKAVT